MKPKPKPTVILPDFAGEMTRMQTRITALEALVREMVGSMKYYADYYGPNRCREILNRPEVKAIMEKK